MLSSRAVSTLRQQVEAISGQINGLRSRLEDLRVERENVANAPLARSDIKALAREWIARRADLYAKQLRVTLDGLIRNPAAVQAGNLHELTLTGSSYNKAGGLDPTRHGVDGALCALMGPTLATALDGVIDAMDLPAEGLPFEQRAARLAQLDATIQQLVAEERELSDAARQAGIVIEPLSANAARRLRGPGSQA
jgi:hypothetical protein